MMNVLVTGGAGYIGSHAVQALVRAGYPVWAYDNLLLGHSGAVPDGRLIEGDLLDRPLLEKTLRDHQIGAVMHFAAFACVPESVAEPAKYYRNNVVGTLSLLEAMRAEGVGRIVFSSTCATYGIPGTSPITEEAPQQPINPYGVTKLAIEQALAAYAEAYDLASASLRYFNAAGAASDGSLGEDHTPETHLIPIVLQVALGQRKEVTIYGNDYATPDGTCIRDYIHVEDLAEAHLLALERLVPGTATALNLGTGRGFSVKQVIDACRRVTDQAIPTVVGPRRPGDPPELVADPRRAKSRLDWEPKYRAIDAIVETAWGWHRAHPAGYGPSPPERDGEGG
jgi:UDP-glucose-4-epimerase GalE